MQPGQFAPKGEDWIPRELQGLRQEIQQLAAANPFAAMGIRPQPGGIDVIGYINSLRPDLTVGVSMDDDGVFLVYDAAGTTPVARFGPLTSSPGDYGVEVLVSGVWVQLGAQAVTWDLVAGKPATFTPSGHTHAGGDITSAVANATNATEAVHAAQADGSEYGWTNNVAGTSFYALWVGNDGGFHLGRNVSSAKYKENVADAAVTSAAVLNLRPVRYDRKPTFRYPEDEDGNRLIGPPQRFEGAKNEFGLIAEEVNEHLPEIVTHYGGEIDGVRYDLLGVALLPVVQQQAADIAALKQAVRDLGGNI
jgi:hypothetical protein